MLAPKAKMGLLRAMAAVWVALSLPLEYLFSGGEVGFSSHWQGGSGYVAAGSHPVLLAWSIGGIGLFAVLLKLEAKESPDGIPSGWRKIWRISD